MTGAEIRDRQAMAPLGDGAIVVTLGERIDAGLNRRAHALAAAVERLRATDRRFGRAVPAYASVLVPFDPLALDPDAAMAALARLLDDVPADLGPGESGNLVEIPVTYGGTSGPDLDDVAALNGLTSADVIDLHASTEYRVYLLGFAPGFAYLGSVPGAIAAPRLETPRERVPAGSVGIAGRQTGVYPFDLPGGWRLIGRTDTLMWDLRRDQPSLLSPGDRVRFVPAT
jgi:inhibitor of KinA